MPEGKFVGGCYRCKSEMWLPEALYVACKHSSKHSFFCPYGHEQIFAEGETEAQILRRERDRLKQQLAQKDDDIAHWRRTADEQSEKLFSQGRTISAMQGAATKAKKRTAAGVCPCCNRSFRQMALHMRNKHPSFKAEEVA